MKTCITVLLAIAMCALLGACGTADQAKKKEKPRSTKEQIDQAKDLNTQLREQQDRDRVLNNSRSTR